jgi:hypothetical protein
MAKKIAPRYNELSADEREQHFNARRIEYDTYFYLPGFSAASASRMMQRTAGAAMRASREASFILRVAKKMGDEWARSI